MRRKVGGQLTKQVLRLGRFEVWLVSTFFVQSSRFACRHGRVWHQAMPCNFLPTVYNIKVIIDWTIVRTKHQVRGVEHFRKIGACASCDAAANPIGIPRRVGSCHWQFF